MKQALAWAALLAACAVHASDGVIEINHAKVMAGSGYPYVITQPGSYRLTSNLIQPDADTHVIEIQASDVTLDLNGFAITGTNVCTYSAGPPPTLSCSVSGSGSGSGMGVNASLGRRVTVKNGSVTGMYNSCVGLGGQGQVNDLSASHCGAYGILLDSGTVSRVRASYSRAGGIVIAYGATISDSEAMYNGSIGIASVGNAVVHHSRSTSNVASGIYLVRGAVTGNTIELNGDDGLYVLGAATYSGNAIAGNGGATRVGSGAVLLNGGGNVCDGAPCP